MTYEPLDLRAFMAHAFPGQRHTHDLSGLGLSVEAVGKAQQDKLRRGPGYEG
jgi:hypothetical protein